MAGDGVMLTQFRRKIAAHMAGSGVLSPAKYVAFGDGGHNADGSVVSVSEQQTGLNHEVLRKELSAIKQEDLLSFTGKGAIEKEELVGVALSEAALIDSDGDCIAVKTFPPKVIGSDERYEIAIRVRF